MYFRNIRNRIINPHIPPPHPPIPQSILYAYNDIFWVINSDNDSGSQSDLIQNRLRVDQMEALLGLAFHVWFHVVAQVLGADVAVRDQDAQDVFLVG